MSTTPTPPDKTPPGDPSAKPPSFNWGGLDPKITHLIAVVLTAIIAIGITVTIESPEPTPSNPNPHKTVHVTLGGPKVTSLGSTQVKTIPLTPTAQKIVAAQRAASAVGSPAVESHLNAPAPSPSAVAAAKAVQPAGQPTIPAHVPLASAYQPGCRTSFVRNYSSRHGAPIDLGVIHWTGSPITAGDSGGLSIVRWFDTSSAQASSNYITDQGGRCWYVVPETQKAWTQAAANPWAVSVEIVNPGVLPLFRSNAGRDAVIRLIRGWHKRWHIPYRIGRVNSNCVPIRSGFLAHRDLGPCGGGHPDVGLPSFVPTLVKEAASLDRPKPVSAGDKATCRKLTWWRTHGRPHGRPERNAVARKRLLAASHVKCSNGRATR